MKWPHAPPHWNHEPGIYFVTASTYLKEKFFSGDNRLGLLQSLLLATLEESGWTPTAWAIFPNHYHFIGRSRPGSRPLSKTLGKIHMLTAKEINQSDSAPSRKVWHNYRDTHLTFERSYLARLRYVMNNAVHHGLVDHASLYPWCSAGWFERTASPAFQKTVESFPTDRLEIDDDF